QGHLLALVQNRPRSRMKRSRAAVVAIAIIATATARAVSAADIKDFTGAWIIRSSTVAPWKDPKNPNGTTEAARLIGRTVTFGTTAIIGPSPIGCSKPVYRIDTVGPDMILEGE